MSNFTFHTTESSSPEGKVILSKVKAGYGFVPNLFAYMAEAPVAVEAYLQLSELIDKSSLSAGQAQVALLAISLENDCDFCTVAHRAVGKMKGANQQSLDALAQGIEIEDESDRAIAKFAVALVQKRGWLDDQDLQAFYQAGFTKQQVFEVILLNSIKTLSNYSNHLTQPEANPELLAAL